MQSYNFEEKWIITKGWATYLDYEEWTNIKMEYICLQALHQLTQEKLCCLPDFSAQQCSGH
jgi:hypothetical protein